MWVFPPGLSFLFGFRRFGQAMNFAGDGKAGVADLLLGWRDCGVSVLCRDIGSLNS